MTIEIKKLDFSVVMPCLNEELTIGKCVQIAFEAAKSAGYNIEVIVADNGSNDNSINIAREFGAKIVSVTTRGYGAALDSGIRSATSDYVVIADGDLSYNLAAAPFFYQKLTSDNLDLVIGNRFKGGISRGAMPPLHKYFGNPVLSGIARTMFSIPLRDFHCGIRGFKLSTYLAANPKTIGMEFATEMVLRFVELNAKISEIPTTLVPDGRNRKPHLRSFPDGWRHLKLMLLFAPQFFLMLPGAALTLLGFALLGEYFIFSEINFLFGKTDIQGGFLAMLISSIGVQLFSAGAVSIAHAKVKGVNRFKWLPLTYSRRRAKITSLLPLALMLLGLSLLGKVLIDWKLNEFGHLDPILESRYSYLGGAIFLSGCTLFIGAIQVRQIISKFW
jgi:glycosyltransferase involved in cell wall biosynthesis